MEYVSLTFDTDIEEMSDGWDVAGEFVLEDIQRARSVNFDFLEGRTIDHIRTKGDFEIIFALKEEYDDTYTPKSIFPDNFFEI